MTVLNLRSGNEVRWQNQQNPTRRVRWEHDSMYGHPVEGSLRTIAHLDWMSARAEKVFGQRIVVIQPPFNTGVAASAGTHDFDACIDWYIPGVGWYKAQRFGRVHGDGCWYRKPPLFPNHIHGFTLPPHRKFRTKVGIYVDGGLSQFGRLVTSSQLTDYYEHKSGLVGHTHDPSWFPKNIDATIFDLSLFLQNKRGR